EVAGPFEHGTRRLAQVDAQLVREDVRQRRLAESRRSEQQHVVERFRTSFGRLDEDAELLADLFLADVFVEPARTQGALERLFLRTGSLRGDHAREDVVLNGHCGSSWRAEPATDAAHRRHGFARRRSACLMPSETPTPSGSCFTAATASRSLYPSDSSACVMSDVAGAGRLTPTACVMSAPSLSLSSSNSRSAVFLPMPGTRVRRPVSCSVMACASSASERPDSSASAIF